MPEILVYAVDHWLARDNAYQTLRAEYQNDQTLSDYERERKILNLDAKNESKYVNGDPVEVQRDQFWTGPNWHGWNKDIFALVTTGSFDWEVLKRQLEERVLEINYLSLGEEKVRLKKRRRFRINRTFAPGEIVHYSNIITLPLVDKEDGERAFTIR